MGTLVRFPERASGQPWALSITYSSFTDMSFCGSIISNDVPLFYQNYLRPAVTGVKSSIEAQVQSDFGRPTGSTIGTRLDCTKDRCFTLLFENNVVQNLNALKRKTPEAFMSSSVNWQMQKFGLAIHLRDFDGDVQILNNVFSDTVLSFSDVCTIKDASASCYEYEPVTTWQQPDQLKTPNDPLRFEGFIPY